MSQQLKEVITNEPIVCYTALHSTFIPTNMVDSTKSNWLVYRAIVKRSFLTKKNCRSEYNKVIVGLLRHKLFIFATVIFYGV